MRVDAICKGRAFGLICSVLLAACGSDQIVLSSLVEAEDVYQRYTVSYNASHNETVVQAEFRVLDLSGASVELESPSEVSHDSLKLKLKFLSGAAIYEAISPSEILSHSFSYLANDGQSFSNSLTLTSIDFPADLEEISRSETWNLVWLGPAIQENEQIRILLRDQSGKSVNRIFNQQGESSLQIEVSDLLSLQAGNLLVELERRRSQELAQARSAGGQRISIYRVQRNLTLN
ncbi:MAG: hypothetical protein EA369_05345 [Bradymonadales bacterium]|nr:MAG: hypothetical protein EA369_05345 [Bradymonadales bacterium]